MDRGLSAGTGLLRKLAGYHGIQTAYSGSDHKINTATADSLLAVLRALGAPIATLEDLPAACREWEDARARQIAEPVVVAWDGNLPTIMVCLPRRLTGRQVKVSLATEDGRRTEWDCRPADAPENRVSLHADVVDMTLPLRKRLPAGYHRLILETGGLRSETMIIAAPQKAYSGDRTERGWGVFVPLYSLHSLQSMGAGSFSDLEKLAGWVSRAGGNTVATLPLLAAYLDRPYEFSPYLPVSKLLWNGFYIDIQAVAELEECEPARRLLNSAAFQDEVGALRRARLVDYHRQMALQRTVLEELSRYFFSHGSRRDLFRRYVKEHPEVEEYARFRAVMEKQRKPWRQWPARIQNGTIHNSDYDVLVMQYHLYAQWLAEGQLDHLAKSASSEGNGLYLDLPLGTHPDGFDTWRFRDIFVDGVSVGAPPDTVFTRGQNWTFPPLHPQKIRETGYDYVISYLRHHMRYARTLRIDHIMGLHRLFFIPHGMESGRGVYVRYHPEEMYAILSLESHRNQCALVGEDLGIVPRAVRSAMTRHNLRRMWVIHYELAGNSRPLLPDPLPNQVASLNTHDMPPFASFWSGRDITDRLRTGIISASWARREEATRAAVKRRLVAFLKENGLLEKPATPRAVLKACLAFLGASRALLVLVNLEDLWLETHTQNIPSTTSEHPNWRRKARRGFESFCQMPQVMSILIVLQAQRTGRRKRHAARGKTQERK